MVGSFLNVVILRLPKMMELEWQAELDEASGKETSDTEPETFNLSKPRSRCNNCGHMITWYENIPVISWLILRGKCSNCSTAISARYPLIEALTALLGGFIGWQYGLGLQGAGLLLLTWSLIALTFIDIDHQLLPDRITLPLVWLGLLLNTQEAFTTLSSAVWGAAIGYLSLWTVYWVFKLLTGKEGMGYGDFKLLAAIGAFGGVAVLPLTILLSSVVGVVLTLAISATGKRSASEPLPFGPYLAIAGWVAIIWGEEINAWYLGLLMH
jgi:leader peptidase (prepilin peptidase)/N-methyltransferase